MTDISSRSRIPSIALVFLLVISSMMFISPATQAQPTGVQTVILRPDGDNFIQWTYPSGGGAGTSWTNITPAGDEYFQGTWSDEGRGGLVHLASGDAYQAAWRVPTTSIPAGASLTEVHIVFYEYNAGGGGLVNCDFAFYTVLAGTAVLNDIGDSTDTAYSYAQGTSLGYFTDGNNIAQWHNYSLPTTALQSQMTSYSSFYFACTNTTEAGYWTGIASLQHATTAWHPYVWVKYNNPAHYLQLTSTPTGGDGDATYVSTSTNTIIDRYTMTDIVPLGVEGVIHSVVSVRLWLITKHVATGVSRISADFHMGASDYVEINDVSMGTTYENLTSSVLTVSPATSVAWTLAEVQALQVQIYSGSASKEIRVTQLGLVVVINYGWSTTFTSTPPTAPHAGYWWPNDAYTYTVTTNSSSTKTNLAKASWQTWTSGNSTLWGRIPITITTQTVTVQTKAVSTNGKQAAWQNYTFNIVNTAPTFSSSPVTTVNANANYYYDANASDPQGLTIVYSLSTNWTGLQINSATGVVNKSATHVVGWYDVSVIANDGLYDTYQTFVVTVTYVASFFTSTPITTIHWNTNYHYDAQVTSSYTITFGMVTNWTGATISSDTGEVNRTAPHSLGWYYVDVNFTDGFAVYWQNYSVNVTNTNPTFTSSPLTTIHWSVSYSYQAIATSGDIDSLTFALVISDWASVTCSPAGLVENTQPFTVGIYYINISVTDGLATIYQNYSVSVTNVNPTFTSTPILSWVFLFNYIYDANAVSGDIDTLTFGLVTNFTSASIVPATGVVTNTQPFVVGSYYLNVSVTDGYVYVYQNFTLFITPGWAALFTSSPVLVVYVNSSYIGVFSWNESVSSHTFTTNASWLTWYPAIHSVLGTSPSNGTYWVNITVTSTNGGLVSWQNYTVTVAGIAPIPSGFVLGPLESTTLAFIFGFGLIGIAFVMRDKRHIFITLAGLVWILSGVLVFPDYDAGWVILSIAFGISLLYEGATGLMETNPRRI